MPICLPSMQEWGSLFGASQAQVQLTFSGFVVAFGLCQLVYGPLPDRYGRKGVLVAGLALMALGSLVAALAPNLDVLIAARVLQGAGSALNLPWSHATSTNNASAYHGSGKSTGKCLAS